MPHQIHEGVHSLSPNFLPEVSDGRVPAPLETGTPRHPGGVLALRTSKRMLRKLPRIGQAEFEDSSPFLG